MEVGPPDPGCVPMPAVKACITPCNKKRQASMTGNYKIMKHNFLHHGSAWCGGHSTKQNAHLPGYHTLADVGQHIGLNMVIGSTPMLGTLAPLDWRQGLQTITKHIHNHQFVQHIHIVIAICHPIYFLPLWLRLCGKV